MVFCLALGFSISTADTHGADWPAYRADAARSGVTAESLKFPLEQIWVYESVQAPRPAWPEPGREMHRIDFDYAFQPVSANGLVYFGSSADDTVRALNADTGKIEWYFTTGGPVRFAPHIADGKCYVASDDGFLYCLDAGTGKLVWRFRAALDDRQLIGNGRMISRWPCRSGVLVVDGVAYVTAGMWPSEGVFVYALDAKTGKQLWCNDTSGSTYTAYPHSPSHSMGGPAPQGYLLASADVLLVPTGRSVPAGYDRRTGKFLYYHAGVNRLDGGSWAMILGDVFLNPLRGTGYDRHVVLGQGGLQSHDGLLVHDISTGRRMGQLREYLQSAAIRDVEHLVVRHTPSYVSVYGLASKNGELGTVEWQVPRDSPAYSAVRNGEAALVGMRGMISACSLADRKPIWRRDVNGEVRGMAIAGGRLFAGTSTGAIYAFAPGGKADAATSGTVASRPASKRAASRITRRVRRAADSIVAQIRRTNITKGYALIVGRKDARLAEVLAGQTQLHVINVLRDAAAVASERRRLIETTALYGTRVVVQHVEDIGRLPYVSCFANVVVVSGKTAELSGTELYRVLRPSGGLMCFAGVRRKAVEKFIAQAGLPGKEVRVADDTVELIRGKLPGAFDWNSEVTSDHRVKWPLELQWFGGPGPARMVSRHWRAPTPVVGNGRYFVIGECDLIGVDAYNGRELWSRRIPDLFVLGQQTAVAADDDSVYVNKPGYCLQLDAQTGRIKKLYSDVPAPWQVFSLDEQHTFELREAPSYFGTVTIGKTDDGLELRLISKTPKVGKKDSWELSFDFRPAADRLLADGRGAFSITVFPASVSWMPGPGPGYPEINLSREEVKGGAGVVVRINWASIRKLTGRDPADFTFAALLDLYRDRQLVKDEIFDDDVQAFMKYGRATFVVDPSLRKTDDAAASAVPVGKLAELPGYARERGRMPLRSGADNFGGRVLPLTRGQDGRSYRRSYGCGSTIRSATMDFFRSGTIGFYDLAEDSGVRNFAGVRTGCGVTMIPGAGLLIANEGAATCTCSYNFQTSLALAPAARRKNEDWAIFWDKLSVSPVRRAALNIGAPGDRRDAGGVLWLGHPRPNVGDKYFFRVPCHLDFYKGAQTYRVNSDRVAISGTKRPWIYASGYRGLKTALLDLVYYDPSRTCLAMECQRPPRIDGDLLDECWDGSARVPLDDKRTSVYMRQDADNLYFAYERRAVVDRRGRTKPWAAKTKGEDAPVWKDDSFELYLKNDLTSRSVHLGVSASGARYDGIWEYAFDIPRLAHIAIDGKPDDWDENGFCISFSDRGTCRLAWNKRGLLLLMDLPRDFFVQNDACTAMLAMATRLESSDFLQVAIDAKGQTYSLDHQLSKDADKPAIEIAADKMEKAIVVEALLPWESLKIEPALGVEIGFPIMFYNPEEVDPLSQDSPHRRAEVLREAEMNCLLRLAEESSPSPVGVTTSWFDKFARARLDVEEQNGWNGGWSSAVKLTENSFRAELAVPWKALSALGIRKNRLRIMFGKQGKLEKTPDGVYSEFRSSAHAVQFSGQITPTKPYTVRLHFAELSDAQPGERLFDVKLQGKVVIENLDIVAEAGGKNIALVKELRDVPAAMTLELELIPKSDELRDLTMPIISGIEVLDHDFAKGERIAGEFRNPMEVHNFGYWYADFVRRQADADVALVVKEPGWNNVKLHGTGPVTINQLTRWLAYKKLVRCSVEGSELIRCFSKPETTERFNPYCPGTLSENGALFYSGLTVSYDPADAKADFGLQSDRTYALAWLADAGALDENKPSLNRARKVAPAADLKMESVNVLSGTTWERLVRESETKQFLFRKKFSKPLAHWEAWRKQSGLAMAAREEARLQEAAKHSGTVMIMDGGVAWKLVLSDDFERSDLGANWQSLRGIWAIENGKARCTGVSFLGCTRKVSEPVRIEYYARTKKACDLSSFWGTAEENYEAGYFIGFGSRKNTINQIVRKGERVMSSGAGPMIEPARWHHIIAQVVAGKVQLIVDGRLALEYVDLFPVKDADMAGLIAWRDSEFDNVRVYTGP